MRTDQCFKVRDGRQSTMLADQADSILEHRASWNMLGQCHQVRQLPLEWSWVICSRQWEACVAYLSCTPKYATFRLVGYDCEATNLGRHSEELWQWWQSVVTNNVNYTSTFKSGGLINFTDLSVLAFSL